MPELTRESFFPTMSADQELHEALNIGKIMSQLLRYAVLCTIDSIASDASCHTDNQNYSWE